MRDLKFGLLLFFMLILSMFMMFAQEQPQTKPDSEQPQPKKTTLEVQESVDLAYKFEKAKSLDYLFSAHTEANVKIRNLKDEKKNKKYCYQLTSHSLLRFKTKEESTKGSKLEISLREIAGSFRNSDENLEFIIGENGMKTNVNGEKDEEIKELDFWESSGNWRDEAPESLNKPLAGFFIDKKGEISKAYTLTGIGADGEKGHKKSLNFLQSPLILTNLLFWKLPEKKLEFKHIGGQPRAPKPAWKSTLNFPYDNPFEFTSTKIICELLHVEEETILTEAGKKAKAEEEALKDKKKKEPKQPKDKNDEKETEKEPLTEIVKIYVLGCLIENKDYPGWQILVRFEYDSKLQLLRLVKYDIKRTSTKKTSKNREVITSQHTLYRFILQDN